MAIIKSKMKSYIQPFEQYLAKLELEAIVGSNDIKYFGDSDEAEFSSRKSLKKISEKLTYWESVESTKLYWTTQSLRESTVNIAKNGISIEEIFKSLPLEDGEYLPNRRCLRYATHGIHEYKGKYFPQLVRSLLNVAGINRKSHKILDPTCGSGTTLVECVLEGVNAIGIDLNPLSVFISRAKCSILKVSPSMLNSEFTKLKTSLVKKQQHKKKKLSYVKTLPAKDQEYLSSWFDEGVLKDLDIIISEVNSISNSAIKNFFLVSLSNILRKVSWQKLDDLRVRKEVLESICFNTFEEFLNDLERSLKLTIAFMIQHGDKEIGKFKVYHGSSTEYLDAAVKENGKVDAIITSPPYATALPYLDTDRLSLLFLGLLPREQHRKTDLFMIGNREISEAQRKQLWHDFLESESLLPESVTNLVKKIDSLNSSSEVGFRRKNLSALLGKYFYDMHIVMKKMYASLKSNGKAFVVIGNNHTTAGGIKVNIDTIDLLADIAKSVGFKYKEKIDMEMLINRQIHKNNATKSESILWLEK